MSLTVDVILIVPFTTFPYTKGISIILIVPTFSLPHYSSDSIQPLAHFPYLSLYVVDNICVRHYLVSVFRVMELLAHSCAIKK